MKKRKLQVDKHVRLTESVTPKKYGFFGWKEFHNSRKEILAEFNRSKGYNTSRPVRTEHGNAGAAQLRKWLSEFLPKKYGVTSGYIIPDVMVAEYKLYHFDVLIYDEINSPVLWIDGDYDISDQGKKRAIPAKHIHAAFEVKARLTARAADEAIAKLAEFNPLEGHLPESFSCAALFFDLAANVVKNQNILPRLIPPKPIVGYWGGLVLSCSLDEEMTGILELVGLPEGKAVPRNTVAPIAKGMSELSIHRGKQGNVEIGLGSAVSAFAGPDNTWHFSKMYAATHYGKDCGLMLTWSHSHFATFALDLLSRLNGLRPRKDRQYFFGQVFDVID